jgi:ribosomal protein L29
MKAIEEKKKVCAMKESEISSLIATKKRELNLLILNIKAGKSDKSANVAKLRKSIAVLSTVLKEKEYSNEG